MIKTVAFARNMDTKDIKHILKWADRLTFHKTGQYLTELQKQVLSGICQDQEYLQIAEATNMSEGYVRNVASQLYQLFSKLLNEKNLKKSNLKSTLDRYYISQVSNHSNNSNFILHSKGDIHICSETLPLSKIKHNSPSQNFATVNNDHPKIDLSDAPHPSPFYNYKTELTTLQKWITEENTQLITILGMSGVGKTALTLNLIPYIKHHFTSIFWLSLETAPILETTLTKILKFITDLPTSELPTNLSELLLLLKEKIQLDRYLIILDDLQTILKPQHLVGSYQNNYENYSLLLKAIAQKPHQSCFIINSWEPPKEILSASSSNYSTPIKTLTLNGIGNAAKEIFKAQGLPEQPAWETLINTYQSHPFWLKTIATTIHELFDNQIDQFLEYNDKFLPEELRDNLEKQMIRLSEAELKILQTISQTSNPLTLGYLLENTKMLKNELANGVRSLQRRSFIQRITQEEEIQITVTPIMKEYINLYT